MAHYYRDGLRFLDVDVPLVILCDAVYPLLSWLMKPFPEGRGDLSGLGLKNGPGVIGLLARAQGKPHRPWKYLPPITMTTRQPEGVT
eukprot:superscaffoldBa00000545_g5541